ncbi:hypothetical protein STRAU_1343 [Streptomyces aurantiacus JA 4570]|uniref:Uncharacterized protein n=1 Tax=Streptomyces aurantiacus JA 4570 TaxID=1286094 RepID=S4AW02_9ACTN|nr:hypothetical protein STRAU_1343 [Streptomyces aurantiacus JA 4570]
MDGRRHPGLLVGAWQGGPEAPREAPHAAADRSSTGMRKGRPPWRPPLTNC